LEEAMMNETAENVEIDKPEEEAEEKTAKG
jgi:hypothetical protein